MLIVTAKQRKTPTWILKQTKASRHYSCDQPLLVTHDLQVKQFIFSVS
jgi:hypothetical protein